MQRSERGHRDEEVTVADMNKVTIISHLLKVIQSVICYLNLIAIYHFLSCAWSTLQPTNSRQPVALHVLLHRQEHFVLGACPDGTTALGGSEGHHAWQLNMLQCTT